MEPIFIGAITLASLGLVLLVHHGCAHANDPEDSHAKSESCPLVCFFQPRDVTHFEACILVCATCGITLAVCSVYIASVILFTAALFLSIVYAFWVYDGSLVHNISNHETWIVVCFSNALVLAIVGGTT
jgi:hypothetical protein